MKRTPKKTEKPVPSYPSATDVKRNRRKFLEIAGKGLLGVSVLGLPRCGFFTSGDAPPPEDVMAPDAVTDTLKEDFALGGAPRLPDTVDSYTLDGTSADVAPPKDIVDEDWALAGAPRPPDTVDIQETWVADGMPPMPDIKDIQQDDWTMAGDDVVTDVKESDWQMQGFAPVDIQEPDKCTNQDDVKDVEDDFPPMAGVPPMPEKP